MELRKTGRLRTKTAAQWQESRLGIGFEKLDRGVFIPEKAYDKLARIGVKWVRLQSGWARTEKEPGVYDFAWLDSIVDNLIERGLLPWMCLCYGNPLYDDLAKTVFGAVGCAPVYTEEQREAWKNYAAATAAHFKGRVEHFEIWNEPDWCWKRGANATELGEFSIATAKAIRAGNPDAYVIGGSICGTLVGFLQEALDTGMGPYLDGISFHEYTYTEQNVMQKVRAIRGLCMLHGVSPEIIQGESGAQSRADGHGALKAGAWTPGRQAKLLLRHLTVDLLSGVKFTSYFTCVDMIEALHGTVGELATYLDYGYFGVLGADFDENGIATGDYTPKPSYYALQNLAALMGGRTEQVDLPVMFLPEPAPKLGGLMTAASQEMLWGGFRLDSGAYALAYWKPAELMTSEYDGLVTLKIAVPGAMHLVDPMDGSVYEILEAETDAHGTSDLHFLPLKDYPLFLTFGDLDVEAEG